MKWNMGIYVVTVALAAACPGTDLGTPTAVPVIKCMPNEVCVTDADCDDGTYCNGAERCDPDGDHSNVCGCAFTASPCGLSQRCDEEADRCFTQCAVAEDADGDGSRAMACGGDDCDDNDPERFPGHTEVCDAMGHDEDCDPSTFGVRDADHDGAVDAACCNLTNCGPDCNDTLAGVHPGSVEACDSIDNDCDTAIDEGVKIAVYTDADGDGYGSVAATASLQCAETPGFSVLHNDCDDAATGITPGTFKCVGGNFPSSILLCNSAGAFTSASCPAQQICYPQPNGTGVCNP